MTIKWQKLSQQKLSRQKQIIFLWDCYSDYKWNKYHGKVILTRERMQVRIERNYTRLHKYWWNNLCSNDKWVACSCRYSITSEVCLHMHSTIIHSATFVHVASYRWDTHAKCKRVIATGISEINHDQYAWHTTFPAMCTATLCRTGKTWQHLTN